MSTQQTLSGGEADVGDRPKAMLKCETCDEWILRSRRFDHPHDLVDYETIKEKQKNGEAVKRVPEDCLFDTQTYRVTFHYEMVEVIDVEASSKADAKEQASHVQEYRGELMETLHTEKRAVGSPSQASIEYLENNGLLPQDHDVTEEDLNRVLDQ